MTQHAPTGGIDSRFSDPSATPTPWDETARTLERAQLSWLTSVRAHRRPHVTPRVRVVSEGAVRCCTGLPEQKAPHGQTRYRVGAV